MFESGAILTYLAERHGRLLPAQGPARYQVLTWLHWQIGGVGPMIGQLGAFSRQGDNPDATTHFVREAERLLGVLEGQLSRTGHLGGDGYSIADVALYPWIVAAGERLGPQLGETLAGKASLQRWLKSVGERPAVQRAMAWQGTAQG
ncbi:glutathione S-transferase family protein [Pseudoduganella plicata]|nr:glutathione S-transferase C-terminal domain-containing protein [Pseudoduganella plicata]